MTVRAVGDPAERMREDRLRALRAIRFAARFEFTIDGATWQAISESAPHLTRLSAERVKQEIEKTMEQVSLPSRAFALWQESGALEALIPSLAAITEIELRTIDHVCLPGLRGRPQRKVGRLTALFASVPPAQVLDTLKGLRFSNADAAWIAAVISRWSALRSELTTALLDSPASDSALRRWAAVAGRTRFASVLRLASARWSAEGEAGLTVPTGSDVASMYRRGLRTAYRDAIEISDLAITGRDLEKIGITGPELGHTLRDLLETVINDPAANTHSGLLSLAQVRRKAGHVRVTDEPQRQQ
ncbi:MAG TPA: hypothetical protein VM939_06975 [Gemmatimonadaceae bacterium]|nr:hypothetical protein [Gemmatimonadaceae bacterium]